MTQNWWKPILIYILQSFAGLGPQSAWEGTKIVPWLFILAATIFFLLFVVNVMFSRSWQTDNPDQNKHGKQVWSFPYYETQGLISLLWKDALIPVHSTLGLLQVSWESSLQGVYFCCVLLSFSCGYLSKDKLVPVHSGFFLLHHLKIRTNAALMANPVPPYSLSEVHVCL